MSAAPSPPAPALASAPPSNPPSAPRSAPPPLPHQALRPPLPERQLAMLAEMGVPMWWQVRAQTPSSPSPAPAPGAAQASGRKAAASGAEPHAPAAAAAASAARCPGPATVSGVAQPSPRPTAARSDAAPTGTDHSPSIGPGKLTHHRPSSSTASGARGGARSASHPALPEHPSAPSPNTNPALPERTPLTLGWAELEQQIRACQRCPLGALRQHAVPGTGAARADWLLVGEAPGQEEDQQGLPFVGRAGQLLQRMLAAMGLERERAVYITNTLKCRPPRNRNPHADEIAHCTPYLLRQIELLQPRIVLALGRFAAQALLQHGGCLSAEELAALPLGKLRGRVFTARFGSLSLPVVVTYHPAYLLRSPAGKAHAWADLCLALEAHAALPPLPPPPA